jgi:hypothetical protein
MCLAPVSGLLTKSSNALIRAEAGKLAKNAASCLSSKGSGSGSGGGGSGGGSGGGRGRGRGRGIRLPTVRVDWRSQA